MHAYHAAAGAGRQHHIVEGFKFGEELECHRPGGFALAGVVAGLAATGLLFGYDDLAAGHFE